MAPSAHVVRRGGVPGYTVRLEWRMRRAALLLCSSMTLSDRHEVASAVDAIGSRALFGEYRLRAADGRLVYTTSAIIRSWPAAGGDLPAEMPRSRWRMEVERDGAIDEMSSGLRQVLEPAVRKGLLPQAAVASLVLAAELASIDPAGVDDLPHGPLAI